MLASRVQAYLNMVCALLTAQLPAPLQGPIKDWLATRKEIGPKETRKFIDFVRQSLSEKGIPLDKGNRDFSRVCVLKEEALERQVNEKKQREAPSCNTETLDISYEHPEKNNQTSKDHVNTIRHQNQRKGFRRQTRGTGAKSPLVLNSHKSYAFYVESKGILLVHALINFPRLQNR